MALKVYARCECGRRDRVWKEFCVFDRCCCDVARGKCHLGYLALIFGLSIADGNSFNFERVYTYILMYMFLWIECIISVDVSIRMKYFRFDNINFIFTN